MAAVRLLYFAWVREKVGHGEETRVLPDHIGTVAELVQWLKSEGPEYANAFANETTVRAAIDQQHVSLDTPLGNAREIAFFPPVTGG